MDRAEATGIGVAAVGHLALLAALSLAFAATRVQPPPQQPIEVSFVEEAAPVSSAPEISPTTPAAKLAPVEGPPEPSAAPTPPVPAPPQPQPQPQPLPPPPRPQPVHAAPAPAPVAHRPAPPKPAPPPAASKPAPAKAAPAKPAPARPQAKPTGRLSGILAGLSSEASKSRSAAAPAAVASPAVQSSLGAEVKRQLKPKWQQVVPSGADVELLRTELRISLGRDGSVTHIELIGTTGVNASNRPQLALHQERAKKAVMLASPFRLPAEYYDAWKQMTVTVDKRLTQ
jgi:outer membrane biosynthesis protein TonB